MKKVLSVLFLSLTLVSSNVFAAPAGHDAYKERYIEVQLLGTNDFHGQLDVYSTVDGQMAGGAEYLAAYLKAYEEQNKNTLIVHAGDMVGASSPVSSLLQDEPSVEFMNRVGFDVGTVGNHEFDEGVEEMMRLIDGGEHEVTGEFEGANFPYTVANVVDEETEEPILPPYIIKKVNGMPIGFVGVVTTDTENIVLPSGIEGVTFTDEATAINNAVEGLKAEGVKSIVVLAHVPASSDEDGANPAGEVVDFAPQLDDEVDVILAGHNHSYTNAVVDGKLIVQSYSYGTAFSKIDLQIDPRTKDIVQKEAKIITTYHDGIDPDSEIKDMVNGYVEAVDPLINRVVGQTNEIITRDQNEAGESALGNLVADSQRAAMDTDFAFMNPGGIRTDLDEGEITWGELYTMLPFGNSLVTMTLTGEQIETLLEQQWAGSYPRILQLSGLHYTWDQNAPYGEKIMSMTDHEGQPIQPDGSYSVTVNNYIAEGGDGFTVLKEGENQTYGPLALDAMVEYIENQGGSIEAPELNRIAVE
ncbi:bifunctional metallophosphatase/5'-nucleotidase [Caldalkalibacillus salinus]|uniref:bifunctional metallophosphatase/5'-nucleotidase n=1 Tax=Caldalkalibacillus salinus TaxID=2803787 RepID=UPI001923A5E6|nr:5'-nucleotidase C-terminal domain-containing protein [Caldalkalibacillus salinus]